MFWPLRTANGRDRRTSQLAKSLSRRSVLRSRIVPLGQTRLDDAPRRPVPTLFVPHVSDTGCAEE